MYAKLFQIMFTLCLHISKSLADALFASNLLNGNLDILRPKFPLLRCSLIIHREV